MIDVINALAAHFPQEYVQWRAQSVTNDGAKAMALAYIDARAVMDRLDAAVGPENWQDSYVETTKGRLICTLSIRFGDEWIAKSDGAGNTDVEGDKGALSDALKRAAVKWGIGRYLYDFPSPWVACDSYDKGGKKAWKRWTEDPWKHVRGAAHQPPVASAPSASPSPALPDSIQSLLTEINRCPSPERLATLWSEKWPTVPSEYRPAVLAAKNERKDRLTNPLNAG